MPQESFKLLPMSALRDLVIEFQLNPYAFFTSGLKPGVSDTDPLGNPYKRDTWAITRFEIVVEMSDFGP